MTESNRREKKLYKDPNDKMIAGVASGFAKYFDIDTTLVRAVWAVVGLGGVGILLYVILWIVLEDEPVDLEVPHAEADEEKATGNDQSTGAETDEVGESNQEAGDIGSG